MAFHINIDLPKPQFKEVAIADPLNNPVHKTALQALTSGIWCMKPNPACPK